MTAATTTTARNNRGNDTTGRSSEELRELVSHWGAELELASRRGDRRVAAATFGERFCVTSSMGDAVLADLPPRSCPASTCSSSTPATTSSRRRHPRRRRGDHAGQPDLDHAGPEVAEQDATTARTSTGPTRTCAAAAQGRAAGRPLADYDAWATGLRRAETQNRVIAPVIGWDAKKGKVKVSPLARWTDEQVEQYIAENGVLVNPLVYDGYPSIGCAPCTRRVAPGEDPRSGRWAGTAKTECGIHT